MMKEEKKKNELQKDNSGHEELRKSHLNKMGSTFVNRDRSNSLNPMMKQMPKKRQSIDDYNSSLPSSYRPPTLASLDETPGLQQ
jgi:hypothetical protein